MAKNEELRPEPQPAPTHYPEEKKEEKTLEEQMEEIKSWNLDTSHERPPIDAEPVQKTVLPEIEMLATPFKLWSGFCDHEVESMEAIGGFITDQAEEVANDDDTGSFWGNVKRDFCKGIIGDDDVTPVSVIGAAMRGGGNFISHGWEGIWTCVGHPYKTTASAGAGIGYAVTHGEEVIDGIEAYWEEFKNMNLNEQLTVGVETVCDVVLAYKSAKELVNVAKGARKAKNAKKLQAAGALETGGAEATGIAAESGEVGGIVGAEGGASVEGAAGEAAEAIDGVAGKGKIRIESAGESGSKTGTIWNMTEGGGVINGREYSQHAMERMAPDTPQVRAELSRRAEKAAEQLGYKPGTQKYYEFCKKYVDPRNIPPSVIEDAIASTKPVAGKTTGTFVHETADVKVIVNANGKVVTVIPK